MTFLSEIKVEEQVVAVMGPVMVPDITPPIKAPPITFVASQITELPKIVARRLGATNFLQIKSRGNSC